MDVQYDPDIRPLSGGRIEAYAVERPPIVLMVTLIVRHGPMRLDYDTRPSPGVAWDAPVGARALGLDAHPLAYGELLQLGSPGPRCSVSLTIGLRVGPTPMRLSWVTSPASSLSPIPTVPSGLLGRTMYLMSEVLS
jgi:hypothetical protein